MNQNKTLSQITIAAGVVAALGSVVLLLFFTGIPFFGWLGDLIGVITAVLLLPFFIGMGKITLPHSQNAGRTIQLMGVAAALLKGISASLIVTSLQPYNEAVIWENIGSTLLGIVVIIFVLANRAPLNLRRGYRWFSLLFGVAMTLNIMGIIWGDQFVQLLEGSAGFGDINPLLVVLLFTATPMTILGFPIWLLWTGRLLWKGNRITADLQTA